MIFPSLCLGVRSLDFGLEAANTASTALAAAIEGEGGGRGGGERDVGRLEITLGISKVLSCQQYEYSSMPNAV